MDLRNQIRARRAAEHITQKALGEKVGVNQSLIYRFEAGKGGLSLSVLEKVCAALGLRLTVEVVNEEVARESA